MYLYLDKMYTKYSANIFDKSQIDYGHYAIKHLKLNFFTKPNHREILHISSISLPDTNHTQGISHCPSRPFISLFSFYPR